LYNRMGQLYGLFIVRRLQSVGGDLPFLLS
jgi:hypothetical protein